VLVNGRRMAPGTPSTSAADINAIPAALIERVDVLTGGASSVYGADAVAGVVNFVLDTDFEGFKINANYGFYNHNNRASADVRGANDARGFGYPTGMVTDGGSFDGTIAFGSSFDDGRGRVTAYAGYRKIDPVLQARRDYSACSLGNSPTLRLQVAGGAPVQLRRLGHLEHRHRVLLRRLRRSDRCERRRRCRLADLDHRAVRPEPHPAARLHAVQLRPAELLPASGRALHRRLFADYEISPAIKPYMEFMFMDNRTVAQIAPSGNFGNTLSINCDNPLLGAGQRAAICDDENLLVSPLPGDASPLSATSLPKTRPVGARPRRAPAADHAVQLHRSADRQHLQPCVRADPAS
jgi:iron complex outermembrane recepter protein